MRATESTHAAHRKPAVNTLGMDVDYRADGVSLFVVQGLCSCRWAR